MSKIKVMPAAALSLPEIEALVGKVADLQMTCDQIRADLADEQRRLDERIAPIRAEFTPRLEKMDATVYALEKTISATVAQIEAWARVHPDRFAKKRSMELLCGTIGFRLSPPRVEFVSGWKAGMCALAMRKLAWARAYLNAPTINREAILRDRESLLAKPDRLAKVGLGIVQTDEFYVEPKAEHTDSLAGRAAA